MRKIYFVTSNEHKFAEASAVIPNLEQLQLDLPEIQSLDVQEIAVFKLEAAAREIEGTIMVEDTSLGLDCINGLPGPLVKWFLRTIGVAGLYEMAKKLGDYGAEARDVFGIRDMTGELHFIEGKVRGTVTAPRGENGFGWDRIFQPEGFDKTYAQMSLDEKNLISHRGQAIRKLVEYLEKSSSS